MAGVRAACETALSYSPALVLHDQLLVLRRRLRIAGRRRQHRGLRLLGLNGQQDGAGEPCHFVIWRRSDTTSAFVSMNGAL